MKLRNILLIVLVFLVIFAVWATIFNPSSSVVNMENKEMFPSQSLEMSCLPVTWKGF